MKSPRTPQLCGAVFALSLAGPLAHAQTISYVDLHPPGAVWSEASDVSGTQQVGTVEASDFYRTQYAARWEGTAASSLRLDIWGAGVSARGVATQDGVHGGFVSLSSRNHAYLWDKAKGVEVDLHPAGFRSTNLSAMGGDQQAGYGVLNFGSFGLRALLWHGTAGSVVDLSPPRSGFSVAEDTDGWQQVGMALIFGQGPHAALWEGSPESFVDLHPEGFDESWAYAVCDGRQGGMISRRPDRQAALWAGTPGSMVLLHPDGANRSEIRDMDGDWQVGFTTTGGIDNAALWNGSAASFRNLHDVLAGDGYTESRALGIEVSGLEARIVGWGRAADGEHHALMWVVTLPDTTPPVIEDLQVDSSVLWPPNGRLHRIGLHLTANDESGTVYWSVMDVTCNEDCDERDIRIMDHDDGQDLELRALRSGRSKEGRIYTLEVAAWDDAGNFSDPVYRTVTVPHDASSSDRRSRKPKESDSSNKKCRSKP